LQRYNIFILLWILNINTFLFSFLFPFLPPPHIPPGRVRGWPCQKNDRFNTIINRAKVRNKTHSRNGIFRLYGGKENDGNTGEKAVKKRRLEGQFTLSFTFQYPPLLGQGRRKDDYFAAAARIVFSQSHKNNGTFSRLSLIFRFFNDSLTRISGAYFS